MQMTYTQPICTASLPDFYAPLRVILLNSEEVAFSQRKSLQLFRYRQVDVDCLLYCFFLAVQFLQ